MNKNPQAIVKSKREIATQKYSMSRGNLLLMMIFTLVNILLLVINADTMLLFSATVPYFAVAIGIYSEINILLIGGIAIAAISMLAYLLCWIFSKKHFGWMIAALVFFVIDTLCLLGLYISARDTSGILDFAIHIWVLYYLIIGVRYGIQLKKLPLDDESAIISPDEITYEQTPLVSDSVPTSTTETTDTSDLS